MLMCHWRDFPGRRCVAGTMAQNKVRNLCVVLFESVCNIIIAHEGFDLYFYKLLLKQLKIGGDSLT